MGWRSGSGFRHVLVLTFNPAVESAWQEDLLSYVDSGGRQFYSREYGEARNAVPQDLDQSKPIVCFSVRSSISLVRIGAPAALKPRNKLGRTTNWDMSVSNEYHFRRAVQQREEAVREDRRG